MICNLISSWCVRYWVMMREKICSSSFIFLARENWWLLEKIRRCFHYCPVRDSITIRIPSSCKIIVRSFEMESSNWKKYKIVHNFHLDYLLRHAGPEANWETGTQETERNQFCHENVFSLFNVRNRGRSYNSPFMTHYTSEMSCTFISIPAWLVVLPNYCVLYRLPSSKKTELF